MADRRGRARGWAILLAVTLPVTAVFHALSVPAALLLGPMVAGIAVAARLRVPAVPRAVVIGAQAIVGCLIAGGMAGALGPVVRDNWMIFVALSIATVGVSGALGYALARLGIVPGPVAIWGSMPGGAAAMVLMAEANGADPRLVAVMVYTRVVTVTAAATALAALMDRGGGLPVASGGAPVWMSAAVVAGGVAGARLLRWPAGTLLVTMMLGVAVELAGAPPLRVPGPVMVAALAAVGWRIGLSFTGEARGSALQMLPRLLVAALLLAGSCGLFAIGLHVALGVDLLTAWLATSPGGLESVAVIAAGLPVDTPFIMAAQSARFGLVMLIGPAFATALSRRNRRAMMHGQ